MAEVEYAKHGAYIMSGGGNVWATCTCGWRSALLWRTAQAASVDWAEHLALHVALTADRTDPTVTAAGGEGAEACVKAAESDEGDEVAHEDHRRAERGLQGRNYDGEVRS